MENEQKTVRIKNGVTGNLENTVVPMEAEVSLCEKSALQAKEDEELLINPGDEYTRITKGMIVSSDGASKIPVDLTIIRKRNNIKTPENPNGGIDVVCIIPSLGMMDDGMTAGRPEN